MERTETLVYLPVLIVGFGISVLLSRKSIGLGIKEILIAGIMMRSVVLFAWPNLSDDFYRFIWDGRISASLESPYAHTPSELMNEPDKFSIELMKGRPESVGKMNSPDYYSVYPSGCQFLYASAYWIGGESVYKNVLALRSITFLFDLGVIWMLILFLRRMNLPIALSLLYALSPVVVLELIVNLHFEGVTLFLVLLGIWLWLQNRMALSAGTVALSASIKLLPIMIVPFLIRHKFFKEKLVYGAMVGLGVGLILLPLFFGENLSNFRQSIDLYFHTFEFNASIYYVWREIGEGLYGYNLIGTIGSITPIIVLCALSLMWWKQGRELQDMFKAMAYAFLIYYSLSSIVHPWYALYALPFGIVAGLTFPVIWSMVAFLSYLAYSENGVEESTLVLVIEYSLLLLTVLVDLHWIKLPYSKGESH